MAEAPVARVCPFNGDTARESAAPLPAKKTMTVRGPAFGALFVTGAS